MKQLTIATESIGFQTGAFFKELTLLVQELRNSDIINEETIAKYCTRTDQCIYKHTGISTNSLLWKKGENTVVIVPTLTRGNVLNRKDFNKFLEKNFKADNLSFYNLEKKGWINPAESRVGGAFSEINFKIYNGEMFLLGKAFTPEEAAAVILHEVGHAYTFLQFIADTVVVNTVLQRTYQELTNANADKKVKLILTRAADDMALGGREWLETVEEDTDKEVAFKVLVSAVQIEPRKMDNKRFFSMNACEELADIFATRHGAGRALVSMRAKFIYQPVKSHGIMTGIGLTILGLGLALLVPQAIFLALVGAVKTSVDSAQASGAVDIASFKQDVKKIRNQFVEKLKLSGLPKEEIKEAIESIDVVDKIIQDYRGNEIDQATAVKFFDMFRRGKMDARASREYTDKLESLASNDLFIRAAQLGTH